MGPAQSEELTRQDAGTPRPVDRLLSPASAVIIGATPRSPELITNVLRGDRPVWGVHPTRREVLGLECFPSVDALPEVPELAVLAVSHQRLIGAFERAAQAGVKAFVVPGLGTEAGVEGAAIRAALADRARELGAELLGPNCMGIAIPEQQSFWIGTVPDSFRPGRVSVLAQSGSVGEALLSLGGRVGFRMVISSGAESVRDAADYLWFLAGDEQTRAVGLFLETVRRPQAFRSALEACAVAGKPVTCLKVGRSAAGQRAALAHTGALVGSDRAFTALLRSAGALRVDDFHELVETLEVLGRRRRPRGRRIGAISESGGECALLADQGELAGIPFAPLPDALANALVAEFPNYISPQNPLDAWAVDEPERVYPRSLELMAQSGAFDILVAQIDLSQHRGAAENVWCEMILRELARHTAGTDIFPAVSSVGSSDPPPAIAATARELDVALLRGAREATRALAAAAGWSPPPPRSAPAAPPVDLSDLLSAVSTHERAQKWTPGEQKSITLPEHESSLILERYAIPVAPHRRGSDPRAAAAAARELGLPVVVKLDGPAHKSARDGVVTGLQTPEAVSQAAGRLGGPVLVAAQVPAGPEVFCGMTRDPDYGPVLAVGWGGVGVEGLEPALALAPLDLARAQQLVSDARLPESASPLAEILLALSRLALEHPAVEEVDVNPLILTPEGPIAVDALVVLSGSDLPVA
ncbi:MAG TPA: acetate--CoA ligase family protein [Solirubrobacteraceae bacterium]|nr:acetate--CoA ligase family protein [Solirubrobacteraceae bacterium]